MDKNRRTAYYTLMDVETRKSYSNIALNHNIKRIRPDSSAFVRELVYGVLENKIYLDYIIGSFLKEPIKKIKTSDITVLRLGVYQIKFLDSVPDYAAVNESVKMAKRFCRGREKFINGVLRSFIRSGKEIELPDRAKNEIDYLSVKYSYEPWIIGLWLEEFDSVDFVEELLEAGNATPDLVVRVNSLKTSRDDLKTRITAKGYESTAGLLSKQALYLKGSDILDGKLYANGMFSVQDESSMLAVDTLDPQPGEMIMDVCAAPGGKSLAIAEKMNNKGQIIARDIYRRKLSIIDKEAERLGINIIQTGTWDATRVDSSMIDKADRVLVDAPCSGLGVVRRKPEIKYKKQAADIEELPRKQLLILSVSSQYVKPGGVLVYSTCTVSRDENQRVINDFLRRNTNFKKEEERQLLSNVDKTDGFYICKMRKEELFNND
ncbi:MAG: 16S rRNA (cytosine(967)-C(5))-methyltransferase RsmB [Eubacteriales bacterium]|nr:16S rRNA (cytosine(967)-C(5))-methyltransferase RsmB [Eubacteriales bacterium]